MTGPMLSVTIVNHCARQLLSECLASLEVHAYTLGTMEVIVVDNASDDSSVEMVRADFPNVIVVAQEIRRGFGANQNIAVEHSTGTYLFLLNPDVTVGEGTLDRLVTAAVADPGVAAVGGPVLNRDSSIRQDALFRFDSVSTPFISAFGLNRLFSRGQASRLQVRNGWPSGGACLIRRSVFDELGGFDDRFFMYSEDTDLFARLVGLGYHITWVPDAVVTHPFPEEPGPAASRREAEKVRSALLYAKKHFGRIGATTYRVGIGFEALLRASALSIPGLSNSVKLHGQTKAVLRGRELARLRYVVRPNRYCGLSEAASSWNDQQAAFQQPRHVD